MAKGRRRRSWMAWVFVLAALAPGRPRAAEEALSDAIFTVVEEVKARATAARADVLTPGHFAQGERELGEARRLFQEKRALRSIQERLLRAESEYKKALDNVPLARVTLGTALAARDSAIVAGAPRTAAIPFQAGNKLFQEAAAKLEAGSSKEAGVRAADAERRFREAELIAIEETVIGEPRRLVAQAELEKSVEWAPRSLGRAKELVADVERRLEADRYERDQALALAGEALAEARRGLALAARSRGAALTEHGAFEATVLEAEAQIHAVAEPLGLTPDLEGGLAGPTGAIVQAIRTLQAEKAALEREKAAALAELEALGAKERGVSAELAAKREREERLKRVRDLFTADEGTVVIQGSRLIVHLKGVTFPPAKDVLLAESYPVLGKVMKAIRELPGAAVTIEGHTDAQGDPKKNQVLSEARARAVRAYIEANMDLSDRLVDTVGYGAARPIANNDTEEGRSQNRRIDVVFNAPNLIGE